MASITVLVLAETMQTINVITNDVVLIGRTDIMTISSDAIFTGLIESIKLLRSMNKTLSFRAIMAMMLSRLIFRRPLTARMHCRCTRDRGLHIQPREYH